MVCQKQTTTRNSAWPLSKRGDENELERKLRLEKMVATIQLSRGGHSNRLCTNTRDRGQELGQAVKAENLEGQAVKGTSQIRKSQGSSTVKGQPDTNQSTIPHLVEQVRSRVKGPFEWRSSSQGPKFKVKIFDRGRGC